MGFIPYNFSLSDVSTVVAPSSKTLSECFNDACTNYFDASWGGSKDRLSNFRGYDEAYNSDWLGWLLWSLYTYGDGELYFHCINVGQTSIKDASSFLYYELLDQTGEIVLESGSIGSGGVVEYGTYNEVIGYYDVEVGFSSSHGKVAGGSWNSL